MSSEPKRMGRRVFEILLKTGSLSGLCGDGGGLWGGDET